MLNKRFHSPDHCSSLSARSFSRSWFRALHVLGWEFWLPLPLLALLFWVGGNLITDQVLSRPYRTQDKLQADTQVEVNLAVTVVTIQAEIDRKQGLTRVAVQATDSRLKQLEYEFPVTELYQVEQAIAEELKMPLKNVRKLVRYRLTG
jgi:hypothetical protein